MHMHIIFRVSYANGYWVCIENSGDKKRRKKERVAFNLFYLGVSKCLKGKLPDIAGDNNDNIDTGFLSCLSFQSTNHLNLDVEKHSLKIETKQQPKQNKLPR